MCSSLNYYIPDCESNFLTSYISTSIETFKDDYSDEEVTVGYLKSSLINCVFLPEHKTDLACDLDNLSAMGGEFAYFLSDLVTGKYDDIHANISDNLEFGKVMWIDNLKIDLDYRGKNIGTNTLKEFIEICKNVFSVDCIFLYPYPIDRDLEKNSDAFMVAQERVIKFYKKLGFKEFDAKFEEYENKLMYMLL